MCSPWYRTAHAAAPRQQGACASRQFALRMRLFPDCTALAPSRCPHCACVICESFLRMHLFYEKALRMRQLGVCTAHVQFLVPYCACGRSDIARRMRQSVLRIAHAPFIACTALALCPNPFRACAVSLSARRMCHRLARTAHALGPSPYCACSSYWTSLRMRHLRGSCAHVLNA